MALMLVLFGTVGCNEEVQAPEPLVELNDDASISHLIPDQEALSRLLVFSSKLMESGGSNHLSVSQAEMDEVFKPFVESGKAIYSEMLNELSPEELESIVSDNEISEEHLAELAVILGILAHGNQLDSSFETLGFKKAFNLQVDPSKFFENPILECLMAASGFLVIKELISNTAALGSMEVLTAKQAAKLLGKLAGRYLGYLGLAFTIYEFFQCYQNIVE